LVAIIPTQMWESLGFHITQEIVFEPTYFLRNKFCHTPSDNLANHFPSKALF
jgi:hypothetical protein